MQKHVMPEQVAAVKVNKNPQKSAEILALATGLEPVTYGLTVIAQ